MEKHDMLLKLYSGRAVNKPAFGKYFYQNGTLNENYISELETNDFAPILIFVDIEHEKVSDINIIKEYDDSGHGRPNTHEIKIKANEYKQIYQILDECFPFEYDEELNSLIQNAIEKSDDSNEFKIIKKLKDKIVYQDNEGNESKEDIKNISIMLELLHHDLCTQEEDYFSNHYELISKKDWKLAHSIIKSANLETYDNFTELNQAFRKNKLEVAIKEANISKCNEYKDAIMFVDNASLFVEQAIWNNNNEIAKWLLNNINNSNVNFNGAIYQSIASDNVEIFKLLLESTAYDPDEDTGWCSPMSKAIEKGDFYVELLLQHGFSLKSEDGYEIYAGWSLDLIQKRCKYKVYYDLETIVRIIKNNRNDIIEELLEKKNLSQDELIKAYIETKSFKGFEECISNGGMIYQPRDFIKAFENGS